MSKIAFVKVSLDDNVPEYMQGIIRIGQVISEDKNGNQLDDHQELVDNREFHAQSEIISFVAKALNVSESIVEVDD